jgi:tRNA G10  N-methylase Trm11
MCGGGTTLIEAKLLGRNAIGVDINYDAVMLTLDRLNFSYQTLDGRYKEPEIRVYHGDARNLDLIEDESIDLIATHPPYATTIPYSKRKEVEGDLSKVYKLEEYLEGMYEVAKESYRVLKPGKYCAVLIGDPGDIGITSPSPSGLWRSSSRQDSSSKRTSSRCSGTLKPRGRSGQA